MQVLRLQLRGNANAAALEFSSAHPMATFTSGRRTRSEQACAMAKNILKAGRRWIANTYRDSVVSRTLQQWVDAHPESKTKKAIARLLEAAMALFTDDELVALSHHFSGDAFDVAIPEAKLERAAQLSTLQVLAERYGGKFITHEGGVDVWHLQFPAPK